jgi:hypothetical protein
MTPSETPLFFRPYPRLKMPIFFSPMMFCKSRAIRSGGRCFAGATNGQVSEDNGFQSARPRRQDAQIK